MKYVFLLLTLIISLQGEASEKSQRFIGEFTPVDNYFQELNYQPTGLSFDEYYRLLHQTGNTSNLPFTANNSPSLTGARYLIVQQVNTEQDSEYVVDFSTSTYIANFWHKIFTIEGSLVAEFAGGVTSSEINNYFIRHGRDVLLPAGQYLIASEFVAPFYIAQPNIKLIPKHEYIKSIKVTNSVTGIGLGIFFGLGFYYLVMSFIRRNKLDLFYAGFILSNFIFNCATLLIWSDVFQFKWFFLGSVTITFSNILYVLFVMRLLSITKAENKFLYYLGFGVISLMTVLLIDSYFISTSSANENNRAGVLLFALYGLVSALVKSVKGRYKTTPQLYLLANLGFLGPAFVATISPQYWSLDTTYASHWGIMAVAIEVILLSFLLSYQLNQVHRERDLALASAKTSLQLARTDKLTGIGNRYALDEYLQQATEDCAFVYVDIDGLKAYNDEFGHIMGDELLKSFALLLSQNLTSQMNMYRISGDEFALTIHRTIKSTVIATLDDVMNTMKNIGYDNIGLSYGISELREVDDVQDMIRLADSRMYQQKLDKRS